MITCRCWHSCHDAQGEPLLLSCSAVRPAFSFAKRASSTRFIPACGRIQNLGRRHRSGPIRRDGGGAAAGSRAAASAAAAGGWPGGRAGGAAGGAAGRAAGAGAAAGSWAGTPSDGAGEGLPCTACLRACLPARLPARQLVCRLLACSPARLRALCLLAAWRRPLCPLLHAQLQQHPWPLFEPRHLSPTVLAEQGCGSGLPGLVALWAGAEAHFQVGNSSAGKNQGPTAADAGPPGRAAAAGPCCCGHADGPRTGAANPAGS